MSFSNLYLWLDVSRIAALTQPDLFFRSAMEMEAVDWLRENVAGTSVILGSYQTGNIVAARAGQRVMLGHWAETVDFVGKETAIDKFFAAETSDSWRQDLLEQFDVDYVWFSPREQALGNFNPATAVYLAPAYQNETITIFTVKP